MEEERADIENIVLGLFKAFPQVEYIALNNGLSYISQDTWKDNWYFIGFIEQPVYQLLDGYPTWVASPEITRGDQEWGKFFLHVSSKDIEYRGMPIQESSTDFASPRFFCWQRDGEGIQQLYIEEEPKFDDDTPAIMQNIDTILKDTLLNPVLEAVTDKKK